VPALFWEPLPVQLRQARYLPFFGLRKALDDFIVAEAKGEVLMKAKTFGYEGPVWATRTWLFLLLLLLAGCGPGEGKLSGRVLYDGKPLPGGTLFFQSAGPYNPVTVTLPGDDSGSYEVVLPVGEAQVSVDNRELEPRPPPPAGIPRGIPGGVLQKLDQPKQKGVSAAHARQSAIPGKYVKIPQRYYNIATSGLKITVERGNQTKDIELTK
jgi:hypothetical protein